MSENQDGYILTAWERSLLLNIWCYNFFLTTPHFPSVKGKLNEDRKFFLLHWVSRSPSIDRAAQHQLDTKNSIVHGAVTLDSWPWTDYTSSDVHIMPTQQRDFTSSLWGGGVWGVGELTAQRGNEREPCGARILNGPGWSGQEMKKRLACS